MIQCTDTINGRLVNLCIYGETMDVSDINGKYAVSCNADDYHRWRAGKPIDEVMHYLTMADRHFLVSGELPSSLEFEKQMFDYIKDNLRISKDCSKYSDRIVLELFNPETRDFEGISEVEVDYERKREPNDY